MSAPDIPLQKAVYAAIVATGAVGDRVYHRVPSNAVQPYCQIGDDVIGADYAAAEMSACNVTVNIVAKSKPEAKTVAASVRSALDTFIEVEGFMTCEAAFETANYFTDADGVTARGVVTFEYLLQPL